jgi:endonuclease/exonuclease/phosphatase family metal-dependent hydrolase
MTIRIMTLNLWCYFDWSNRKDNIVSLVKELNPDFVAFQETQTNLSFSNYPQSDFIANACGYRYRLFAPTYGRDGQVDQDGNMTQRTSYGLALISKYPVISSETYFLRQHPGHDEVCSILLCTIDMNGTLVDVCNVHFGNSDLFADLHLNEVMDLCKDRSIQPVLLGDFNIFDLSVYTNTRLKSYTLSSDVTTYKSMPKNDGTLDYIVVPSARYELKEVLCPEIYVSDHKALFATVEQKLGTHS